MAIVDMFIEFVGIFVLIIPASLITLILWTILKRSKKFQRWLEKLEDEEDL